MELSGRLAAFSVADVLQWAAHERRTGSIRFRGGHSELQVALAEGQVVGCLSTDPAQFFARHLVLEGLISDQELFKAVLETKTKGVRLGRALVELGQLGEDEVRRSLTQHVFDSVCGVVLWRHGVFSFSSRLPDQGDPSLAAEPIDPLAVALEGSRWADELEVIRRRIPHDDVELRPGPGWPGDHLQPRQRRLLGRLYPGQRLRDLYRDVGGSYFRFMQTTDRLVEAQVVEVHVVAEREQGSEERSLLDTWVREAVDNRLEDLQLASSLPLECLENLYPVYLGPAAASAEDEALHRGELDGTRRLGDWLQRDDETRERQMRWLAAELQAGHIALLAAAGGSY